MAGHSIGEDEVLRDDSLDIAQRLTAVGGIVDLHVRQGLTHVFLTKTRLRAAAAALRLCRSFFWQVGQR